MRRRDGSVDTPRLGAEAITACAPAIVRELALGTGEKEMSRGDLATLRVPTTWIVGTDSQSAFEKAARRAAAAAPGINLRVAPGAGHAIHLDRPDVVEVELRSLTAT